MRKIETQGETAKRRKKNQIVVGVVLALVMVLSTLGFAFQNYSQDSSSSDTNNGNSSVYNVEYNGYTFNLHQSGLWILNIGNSQFAFSNLPSAVEGINMKLNPLNNYIGKPLYISSENQGAEAEIYRNLDQIVLRRQYACLSSDKEPCNDKNFPEKTCQDNFIIIREDSLSTIIQEDNCVYILGSKEELPKLADEFLYKIMGVEY